VIPDVPAIADAINLDLRLSLACYLYTPGTAHRDELLVQWSGLRGMSASGTGLGCG
jgi:hypothetical protein